MSRLWDITPQYLHTSRLTLERLNHSAEHYACFLAIINNPTAHATLGDFGITTPEQIDAMNLPARLKGPQFINGTADDDLYYMIRLGPHDTSGELVGGVSLCQRTAADGNLMPPDLGWGMVEGQMGKGYATEAARELLRWTTEEFGVEEIAVMPGAHNPASIRVAEKLGLVVGGQVPDQQSGLMWRVYVLPGSRFKVGDNLSIDMHPGTKVTLH